MSSKTMRNLFAGLRLLIPGRIGPDSFHPSLVSAFLALAMTLISMAVLDYANQEGEIEFSDYGAAAVGSLLFVVMLVSIIVAQMQSGMTRLPLLLTVLFSAMPWYVMAAYVYRNLTVTASAGVFGWALILIWGISITARAIRVTFGNRSNAEVAVALSSVFLALFVFDNRYLQLSLFYSYDPAEYERITYVDVETSLVGNQIADTAKARGITEDEVVRDVILAAQPQRSLSPSRTYRKSYFPL